MKKIVYLPLWIILLIGLFTSCDSFLDQEPKDSVSDQGVIVDESSAKAALNGAYHQLGVNEYYGGGGFISAIYLASDNVSWTGSLNYYNDFNIHQYGADNQLIKSSWGAIYAVVNQANQVIDKVAILEDISATERNRIIAEATVIRSLALFDLARAWGNIPVVKEATSSPDQFDGVKQSTAAEVYQTLIADLLDVYEGLPEATNRIRVTKAAANAFLARLFLYAEDWENAERYASLLIADENYELIDYPDFYRNKQSRESIWELAYSTANTNRHSEYWLSPDEGGRHEWGPSAEIVQLLNDPQTGGSRSALVSDQSTAQVPGYYVGNLYYRSTADDPAFLFRIAEQYLIRAEARVKKSSPDLSGALADLNAVRERAAVPPSGAATRDELILAVELENRIEFALEVNRWFDLVRTDRATTVLGIDRYKTRFPIPYNDIQADKDLVQNTGY